MAHTGADTVLIVGGKRLEKSIFLYDVIHVYVRVCCDCVMLLLVPPPPPLL